MKKLIVSWRMSMLCTLNTLGRTAVFLLFFSGFQSFAGIPAKASTEQQVLVEATKLLNRSVRFVEREKTGEINELYMDPATGSIPFCMLSFEFFLSIMEKRYILSIPWHDVNFDSQNQQFVMEKIKTGEGGELEPLPYKPEVHKAISPAQAEQIFSHYKLQNLLHQTRTRLGVEQNIPVVDIIRLTNIPIYSQGTFLGRAEKYFMSLDTGMVRMVLVNYTREGHITEDFVMIPFPVLTFDSSEFIYRLTVPESEFSQAPHFANPVETYYPLEQMKKVYSKFGLSNLLVK